MHDHQLDRRGFLAGLAGLTTAIASRSSHAQTARTVAAPRFMYVGSFTSEGRGHGEGISVFERKANRWSLIQLVKELADPSFITVDRQKRHLYSAHGDGTEAVAYAVDDATGRLSVMNRQPTRGSNGVHLAIDATGRFLALANYATGSLVVLPIAADGSLGAVSDLAPMTGTPGPHKTEQQSAHPHHCPFDRLGRFVVVPDKGLDAVFVYRLDAANGKLIPGTLAVVKARAGAAPRHVDFHPTRPFAYVINELDSTITTYAFDPEHGVLEPRQIHT